VGDLIAGQIDPPEDDRDPVGNGYFIVDTTSGYARIDLAAAEYRRQLMKMGVMKANRFMTLQTTD
jgi:hypothetical protein